METFALLEAVLYRFRDLLGSQNFALFCAFFLQRDKVPTQKGQIHDG